MAAPCLIASEKRTARLYRWSWVFGDTEWTLTFSSNPRQTKQESWRREWDSNPRYGFPYTRFPSVRLQPLGHPSATASAGGNIMKDSEVATGRIVKDSKVATGRIVKDSEVDTNPPPWQ